MKIIPFKFLLFIIFLIFSNQIFPQQSWIRINQLGYLNNSIKIAVLVSKDELKPMHFELVNAETNKPELVSESIKPLGKFAAFKSTFRLNFSKANRDGNYYLKVGDIISPIFKIGNDVYKGTADFLLKYLRQQQCGYNPF